MEKRERERAREKRKTNEKNSTNSQTGRQKQEALTAFWRCVTVGTDGASNERDVGRPLALTPEPGAKAP